MQLFFYYKICYTRAIINNMNMCVLFFLSLFNILAFRLYTYVIQRKYICAHEFSLFKYA